MQKILSKPSISIKTALSTLSKLGEKCLIIVNNDKKFLGTLSDGDIRKGILSGCSLDDSIQGIYQTKCTIFREDNYDNEEAKKVFSKKRLDLIPVVDSDNKVKRVIYWEDLILRKKYLTKKINIPVVIMAGGSGTRLAPFTNVLPKPLIPIGEETIIEKIIACLSDIFPTTRGLSEVRFILESIFWSKKWLITAEDAAKKLIPINPKKNTCTGGVKSDPISIPLAQETNNNAWTPGFVSSR